MTTKALLFFLLLLTPKFLFSQDQRCASSQYQNLLLNTYPQLQTAQKQLQEKISQIRFSHRREEEEVVYKIPVVVHVIYYNEETNISDERIRSQIQVLNEDYGMMNADINNAFPEFRQRAADVNIEFCLATCDPCGNYTTGINRILYNQTTLWNGYDDSFTDIKMKALSYWPSDQYLNIWVADLGTRNTNGTITNTLGYASFPSNTSIDGIGGDQYDAPRDGVAIDYNAFGREPRNYKYDHGRTATHEVGHWLGLIHIWGDSQCGNDFVADTPQQRWHNLNMSTSCTPHFSDCTDNNISDATRDMHENFMDYSPDRCMSIFTYGQKERMRAVMESSPRRLALKNSNGCCAPPNLLAYPLIEDFEGSSLTSKGGYTSDRWVISSPGGENESFNSLKLSKNSTGDFTSDTIRFPYVSKFVDEQISMIFNYAYATSSISSNSDSIVLVINPGCSDELVLAKLYGEQLVTSERLVDNFVPNSGEWKSFMVDLGVLEERTFFQISIINYSHGGNSFYIDDINIYKSPLSLNLEVFPNPADEEFNMVASFKNKKNVSWELYDMLGHKVRTGVELQTISLMQNISTTDLQSGVYILIVTADEEKAKQKIVIFNK